MGKLRPNAGFSLIELIVVVSIAAIVMAVLVPGIRQASDVFQLRKGASLLIAELRTAQSLSTANQIDIMFEFYTSSGAGAPGGLRYWGWSGSAWYELRKVETPEWPVIVQLREGSGFPNCPSPAVATHRCTTFKPLGYLTNGGEVKIRARSAGSEWDIELNAATGRVTIDR